MLAKSKFFTAISFVVIIGLLVSCIPEPIPARTATPSRIIVTNTPSAVPSATSTPTLQPTPLPANKLPWYNQSVFYEIFVRSFYDGNGDGIGDFKGLIAKLDYLNDGDPATHDDLGITGIWLMPINPSPSYHGYDVTDYMAINPDYGTMDEFKQFLSEAHKRGIKVIIDFVLNHTSVNHPWFQAAQDPTSKYHNYYIWSATDPGYLGPWGEKVWYPTASGLYYYAMFDKNMPDLNYRNPDVTQEMDKITQFWLKDVGIDGFRLDAARHLIEDGETQANTPETHAWYKQYRPFYKGINPNAMTIGEVADNSFAVSTYVKGDELDLAFDFDLANAWVVGARSGNGQSLASTMSFNLGLFQQQQVGTFLTNHDQNRVMYELAGDVEKAKSAAALLLTSPGVPFIYYGEEIGMTGAKPDPKIRTPMQWSTDNQAGFTTGSPWESVNNDYNSVNVTGESKDANSLLAFYRLLIDLRNTHQSLREGDFTKIDSSNKAVVSYFRTSEREACLVILNLGSDPVADLSLTLSESNLRGSYNMKMLMGSGLPAKLTLNESGGFSSYNPSLTIPAHGSFIILLTPSN